MFEQLEARQGGIGRGAGTPYAGAGAQKPRLCAGGAGTSDSPASPPETASPRRRVRTEARERRQRTKL